MANPLFNSLSQMNQANQQPMQNQNGMGNPFDLFGGPQKFQQTLNNYAQNFMAHMSCTPEQKVQELLASGQMTQAQFNQLSAFANRLTGRN